MPNRTDIPVEADRTLRAVSLFNFWKKSNPREPAVIRNRATAGRKIPKDSRGPPGATGVFLKKARGERVALDQRSRRKKTPSQRTERKGQNPAGYFSILPLPR